MGFKYDILVLILLFSLFYYIKIRVSNDDGLGLNKNEKK